MKSLQIAATGMAAQQLRVDVISNNIANMSTAAYRPRVAEFSDLMYQQYLTPGTITSQVGTVVPAGIQIGTGVRPSTVSMQIIQGSLKETGSDLDIGIDGAGFLEVTLPSGEKASRSAVMAKSLRISTTSQPVRPSARYNSSASSTRRAWRPWAITCSGKRQRRVRPRKWLRELKAQALSGRAISKNPASMWSRRFQTSSRRNAAMSSIRK